MIHPLRLTHYRPQSSAFWDGLKLMGLIALAVCVGQLAALTTWWFVILARLP